MKPLGGQAPDPPSGLQSWRWSLDDHLRFGCVYGDARRHTPSSRALTTSTPRPSANAAEDDAARQGALARRILLSNPSAEASDRQGSMVVCALSPSLRMVTAVRSDRYNSWEYSKGRPLSSAVVRVMDIRGAPTDT